jgi:hypothetical protein
LLSEDAGFFDKEVDMGGGDFGGNGSVEWEVNAHNARKPPQGPPPACTPLTPTPGKPNPHKQTGTDKTLPNGRFTIRIKLPKNPADPFLTEIQTAAASPTGGEVLFTLPIEDIQSGFNPPTPKQIRIDWPSDGGPAIKATAIKKTSRKAASRGSKAKRSKKKSLKRRK